MPPSRICRFDASVQAVTDSTFHTARPVTVFVTYKSVDYICYKLSPTARYSSARVGACYVERRRGEESLNCGATIVTASKQFSHMLLHLPNDNQNYRMEVKEGKFMLQFWAQWVFECVFRDFTSLVCRCCCEIRSLALSWLLFTGKSNALLTKLIVAEVLLQWCSVVHLIL